MPDLEKDSLFGKLLRLSERSAEGTPIEIVDVELRGSGRARLLRIYIDKAGGVTHGDCQVISERLGELLDETDIIPGESYTLEVSSPGVDRPLKKHRDFERAVGQKVRFALREPIGSHRHLEGKLAAFESETLAIETGPGEILHVPLSQVQKANLKFEW